MAAGDLTNTYATTPGTLTQTALDGIASSATWIAGWGSATIDNSSTKYPDFEINAVIQLESTGLSAGQARLHIVPIMNAADAYPDCLSSGTEGTEGAVTFHSTQVRDGCSFPIAFVDLEASTAGNSRYYHLFVPSLRAKLGFVPRKFFLFITQSSGSTLETTGDPNQVYVYGRYENIAQS